jgi:hypothetical protein
MNSIPRKLSVSSGVDSERFVIRYNFNDLTISKLRGDANESVKRFDSSARPRCSRAPGELGQHACDGLFRTSDGLMATHDDKWSFCLTVRTLWRLLKCRFRHYRTRTWSQHARPRAPAPRCRWCSGALWWSCERNSAGPPPSCLPTGAFNAFQNR